MQGCVPKILHSSSSQHSSECSPPPPESPQQPRHPCRYHSHQCNLRTLGTRNFVERARIGIPQVLNNSTANNKFLSILPTKSHFGILVSSDEF